MEKIADFGDKWGKSLEKWSANPHPDFLGVSPGGIGIKCHTVIVNFCSRQFYQPLHMQKLKDDMIGDDKNDG